MNSICPTCGHVTKEYTHVMNKKLVRILQKMPENVDFIMSQVGLEHTEINNAHKLQYWGLIEKRQGNYWTVTRHGREFLQGIAQIYTIAKSINGKRSHFDGKAIYIHSIIDMPYLKRIDYGKQNKQSQESEQQTLPMM